MIVLLSREWVKINERDPGNSGDSVTKSGNSFTEEGKTIVMSSGLALLIFLLYFVLLKVCNLEGYDNKF